MIRIVPQGNQWVVRKNGTVQSNHRKKNRAVQSANRVARSGESVVYHRSDGSIQKRVTKR